MIEEFDSAEALVESLKPRRVKNLPVMEIFGPTLQGEGLVAGTRTAFIRFGLCDYKCTMCDSMHAVDPKQVQANATWMTPEEIVEALISHLQDGCEWVTFSGGNPCIHDLSELIMRIRGLNLTHGEVKIAVETQGTMLPEWLHWCDVVTVSPKTPSMGEKFEQDKFLEFMLGFKHHKGFNVKVVVFCTMDLEWVKEINNFMIEEGLGDRMYLSLGNTFPPGLDKLEGEPGTLSKDDLRINLLNEYVILTEELLQIPQLANVKFLPQLHVLMWGNKQGV